MSEQPLLRARNGTALAFAIVAGVLGLVGGLGFALWAAQGRAVVFALGETVAAWCF